MAIVTMKRLRLFAMSSDRDQLLRQLQHLGCVEFSEQSARLDDPEWAALAVRDEGEAQARQTEVNTVTSALAALETWAPVKTPMLSLRPEITEEELFREDAKESALRTAETICGHAAAIRENQARIAKLASTRASLVPWEPLDVPLEFSGTELTSAWLLTCPAETPLEDVQAALAAAADETAVYAGSVDTALHYFLVICHKTRADEALAAMKPLGVAQVSFRGMTGTAKENIEAIDRETAALTDDISAHEQAIQALKDTRMSLKVCLDRLNLDLQREQYKERLLRTDRTFFMEGWVTEQGLPEVEKLLGSYTCAWEVETPEREEYPEVPVRLQNGKIARTLNMVTDMYALPAYGTVDPNPCMAPFFIFFYGFMFADMGYGIVMMLLSLIIMKKSKPNGPTMRYMIPLMGLCGASTFVMGFLTGGFFGDLIPQIVELFTGNDSFELWSLFSPLDDAVYVLVASLVIGVIQIITGMIISFVKKIKRGETLGALCDEGAWFLIFICIGLGFLLSMVLNVSGAWPVLGIIIAVIFVATQGYGRKGILGKLVGIGGSLYNHITGYFSDILSYSRLMALMLSGAVIAQVFNTLGAMTGNIVTFLIIALIGNGLNFALNLLGCFVHDMRLQCLEFFGYFYEDGGKAFAPLEVTTKYVDIVENKT